MIGEVDTYREYSSNHYSLPDQLKKRPKELGKVVVKVVKYKMNIMSPPSLIPDQVLITILSYNVMVRAL